jgi:quercetin dioxygenase-like cupin family protein
MITRHTFVTASDSIGRADGSPSAPLANGTATVTEGNGVRYVPAGTGPTYRSPIDEITFLLTGEQTGGAFFMAKVSVSPGGGTPPHLHHREEETFYLQQGTLTVQVGGKTLTASAGDVICLPRGVVHCFQNTGDVDAKFLVVATPAGLEKFFEDAFYPAGDRSAELPPMTAAFMARLLEAASKCGLEFLPPASQ